MSLDVALFFLFNGLAGQSNFADAFIIFLAQYLPWFLSALFPLLLFRARYLTHQRMREIGLAILAIAAARLSIEIIRLFVHRPRPFLTMQVTQLLSENSWSFPSGHATFLFAMATIVCMYDKKWGMRYFAAAAVVCAARVAAGLHYPSDIFAGALIGSLIAYGVVWYMVPRSITSRRH